MYSVNDINTDYMLSSLSLNFMKINDVDDVGTNPKTEDLMFDSMDTQTPVYSQNIMNFNDTVGTLQVADDALKSVSDMTNTLGDLDSELKAPNTTSEQKASVESQIKGIQTNISDLLTNTTYEDMPVFGQNVNIGDKNINLGINAEKLDLSNSQTLKEFDEDIKNTRGDIDSFLKHSSNNLDTFNPMDDDMNFDINNENSTNNNYFNFLNSAETDQIWQDSYSIAQSHNQDYLSSNIEQLLGINNNYLPM